MKKVLPLSLLLIMFSLKGFSDTQKSRTISQKNSKCSVVSTSGEYPIYSVFKEKKVIFAPKSDGIVTALISPSGKYVALSAGEINLIDIEKDRYEYGVVVVNCETNKIKGYRKGQPTLITKWEKEDGLYLSDFLNLTGNSGDTLP